MENVNRNILIFLIYIFPCMFFSHGAITYTDEIQECRFQLFDSTVSPDLYTIHGEKIHDITKALFIHNSPTTPCFINATYFLDLFDFPEDEIVTAQLGFGCRTPSKLIFTFEENQKRFPNVIGYLNIAKCTVYEDGLHEFASVFDLKVVNFQAVKLVEAQKTVETPSNLSNHLLRDAVALSINDKDVDPENSSVSILKQNITFPLMKEVAFVNMGWKYLPEYFKSSFPRLEALELPSNNLEEAISFRWNEGYDPLPRNLSRSRNFQSHYSTVYYVDIEPNIYRRIINLGHNKITNLTYCDFRGSVHMIMLHDNGLVEIGENCFTNVQNLQHLRLDHNNLTKIGSNIFSSSRELRYIDLSHNFISGLRRTLFRGLENLQYLNLGHNKITHLPEGIFSALDNLRHLSLEANEIHDVGLNTLPVFSVDLKYVNLSCNPLSEVPLTLFYIRSLIKVDLRDTFIKLNFSRLVETVDKQLLLESVIESGSDAEADPLKPPKVPKVVDLTGSNVTRIITPENDEHNEAVKKLLVMLIHFEFILDNNPIICDCSLVKFFDFVAKQKENGTLRGDEYFLKQWTCSSPKEFSGRTLENVKPEETYCEETLMHCPGGCRSYKRTGSGVIIIDCQDKTYTQLPEMMPGGVLDLWFQRNNISSLDFTQYLHRVRSLNLEANAVRRISKTALHSMKMLKHLNIRSNLIISLPVVLTKLSLESMYIGNNPLVCDCKSVWMKAWIEKNKDKIRDWDQITCNTEGKSAKLVIETPDSEFVCKTFPDLKPHITKSIVAASVTLFIVILLVCVIYVYRFEVKVLLYYHFHFHPFDTHFNKLNEEIDISVIYSLEATEWVHKNVFDSLENDARDLKVFDFHKDSVAGFSYLDNLDCVIAHSKRMLLVLSPEFIDTEVISMLWTEAYKKIQKSRLNFLIVVTLDISQKTIKNPDLRKYVKHGCSLDSKEMLFREKLLYHTPSGGHSAEKSNLVEDGPVSSVLDYREAMLGSYNRNNFDILDRRPTIFISYTDATIHFVTSAVMPTLEEKGYIVHIPDRDFLLGAAKEENILNAIDTSDHTLIVASETCLQDEWSTFTFRSANQKSLREKSNHLIFVFTTAVDKKAIEDEEIKQYINYHVTLSTSDTLFWERLYSSLRKPKSVTATETCKNLQLNIEFQNCDNPVYSPNDIELEINEKKNNIERINLNRTVGYNIRES